MYHGVSSAFLHNDLACDCAFSKAYGIFVIFSQFFRGDKMLRQIFNEQTSTQQRRNVSERMLMTPHRSTRQVHRSKAGRGRVFMRTK